MNNTLKLLLKLKPTSKIQMGIKFFPDTFPRNCVGYKVFTDNKHPPKFLEDLPLDELLSLQFALEFVLNDVVRPAAGARMKYDIAVKDDIEKMTSQGEPDA